MSPSLIETSDIISIHAPVTQETAGILNHDFFAQLKPNAIVINTARGGFYKSMDDIYEALKQNPGLRIATDTWIEEPPKPHLLLEAWKNREPWLSDRLIIYPHTAFYSEQALYNLRFQSAQLLKIVFDGNKPQNVVNGVVI